MPLKQSSMPMQRTPNMKHQTVTNLWQNIWKKTKKDHANHHWSTFATGSGPAASQMGSLSETVVEIMGSLTMDPISDVPDDDEEMRTVYTIPEASSSASMKCLYKASDLKQLQLTLLQEKIEQQRELHAAQMDLVQTMKLTVEQKAGLPAEEGKSFLEILKNSSL